MTKRRLERDYENQLVAGVLSGLANYFDQDPRLFRLVAIIFLILTGVFPGLLMYVIAWFMIPKKNTPEADYDIST